MIHLKFLGLLGKKILFWGVNNQVLLMKVLDQDNDYSLVVHVLKIERQRHLHRAVLGNVYSSIWKQKANKYINNCIRKSVDVSNCGE